MWVIKQQQTFKLIVAILVVFIMFKGCYFFYKCNSCFMPCPTAVTINHFNCLKPDTVGNSFDVSLNNMKDSTQKLRQRLPKALIIGLNKCGTAALRSFLSIHPDVVSPTIEIRFFIDHYDKGLEWYRKQMPMSTSSQLTIEKTPGYIKTSQSLRRIKAFDPDIKLFVIVRNPVTRLQSEYAHEMSEHRKESERVPFRTWMYEVDFREQVANMSDYTSYFRRAFQVFPENQFLILSEEELEKDPIAVIQQAEKFLGLREVVTNDAFVYNETKGFYCFNKSHEFFQSVVNNGEVDLTTGCLIETKGRQHPIIEDDLLQNIIDSSKQHVEDLFKLIHKKFDWKYY